MHIINSFEYKVISDFYGDRCAKRSGVRLMNHIDEGIALLTNIGASDEAKLAFCIHPIVQNDEDVDVRSSSVYDLGVEYRDKANSYLCRPENDHIKCVAQVRNRVGIMSIDCVDMLIADKLQNQKDFVAYHRGTHDRSEQLDMYFNLWLSYLHELKVDL